jgi:TolB-like protein/DNA-binding winged helix-turn-helix (wHTH) protein
MGPPPPSRVVRFGVFELDLHSGELRKQGHKIRLEGQPVQVLICLLENPGELISREYLHRKLWPQDTFVNFDHGLNAAVKRLRRALNDSANNPRFVETLPRRGYRFIAPLRVDDAAVEEPPAIPIVIGSSHQDAPKDVQPEPRRSTYAWRAGGAALMVALAAAAFLVLRPASRPLPIRSLAVLPLENLSGDASQEYFSDGMTDELITELGHIGELRVISRTSIMTYKNVHKPLPQIARELNVDAVVEGTILRSDQQIRITAQLIHAASDRHLWAQSYEGDVRDALALQRQVAIAVAKAIRVELTPREQTALKKVSRVDPRAYEDYLKGRYFWNKRTAEGLRKALGYFYQATEEDPAYAPAYAGLADSYALLGDWEYGVLAPKEAYPKAKAAAAKAMELDDSLAEAHISLAFVLQNFDWDWASAKREFDRGLELSPRYATGHHWYAWYLTAVGRTPEAIAEMKIAQDLDPLSLIIGADLAEELIIAHRYDEAIAQSRKTIDMDPRFAVAHYELGQALVQKHMHDSGIAELQKAIEFSGGSSTFKSNLAYAYAVSGRRDKATEILGDLKKSAKPGFSNASEIALVHVGLNEYDQAMEWLETADKERFNPSILMRPAFDPLRTNPGFQNLLRRIGLR